MIYGIGLDIVEVERIKKAAIKQTFMNKIFSQDEIQLFEKRKMSAQVIAGNFAAKEAYLKAIGLGVQSGFIKQVKVLRDEYGKPYIKLVDDAKVYADNHEFSNILVSITNIKNIAAAQVIIEKEE